MTLFIGGPRHGQELDVPANCREWIASTPLPAVPEKYDLSGGIPEYVNTVYIRRRMGAGGTRQIRSVFAPSTMSGMDAEMALFRFLAARWVNEAPDGGAE